MATLDRDPEGLGPGAPLPLLWHWLYFLPEEPSSGLGSDGHPRRGDFMPPVDLPRRMFAGFELEVFAPITIGCRLRRREKVVEVAEKQGGSGPLVFVTVKADLWADGERSLRERVHYAYLGPGEQKQPPAAGETAPPDFSREIRPDTLLLFRFSALTFNAHRIHYDRNYATKTEGYPGLVVPGPLIAVLLAGLAGEHAPPEKITSFSFTQRAPLFDGNAVKLMGYEREGGQLDLLAVRHDQVVAAKAGCAWRQSS